MRAGRITDTVTFAPDPAPVEWTPRQRAVLWAQAMVGDSDAVYLDTETTGTGPYAHIVDIAIVASDGSVLLDTLVRPAVRSPSDPRVMHEIPIPREATDVHGITDELVADAPWWGDVADWVTELLSGRTVCIYNAGYDVPVLNNNHLSAGRPEIEARWECALLAYAEFDGTRNTRKNGFKWHRLDVAARRFGIPPGGHRALADTQATRLVVAAMAAAG